MTYFIAIAFLFGLGKALNIFFDLKIAANKRKIRELQRPKMYMSVLKRRDLKNAAFISKITKEAIKKQTKFFYN